MAIGVINVLVWYKTRAVEFVRHILRGGKMSRMVVLCGAEPRRILETMVDRRIHAIMSYMSRRKWHVAKVQLTELGVNRFSVQIIRGGQPHPINIQVDQPVGVSLKDDYGKFVFETKVLGFEPSSEGINGGTVVLMVPDRMEIVQRRNYFRVDTPKSLKVEVLLWHRSIASDDSRVLPENYYHGRLVNISAGGTQVAISAERKPDFEKGRFVVLRFTPMPYEMPLMFNAQVRNILPTADGKNVCLGLQAVGLEASDEGHQILQRLCDVVERYYQLNHTGIRQQDFQPANT